MPLIIYPLPSFPSSTILALYISHSSWYAWPTVKIPKVRTSGLPSKGLNNEEFTLSPKRFIKKFRMSTWCVLSSSSCPCCSTWCKPGTTLCRRWIARQRLLYRICMMALATHNLPLCREKVCICLTNFLIQFFFYVLKYLFLRRTWNVLVWF